MRNIDEVRARICGSLQNALSRGSMYGQDVEIFQREFLMILAFIDQRDDERNQHFKELQEAGAFNACGVRGGFSQITGAWGTDQEIGSVYAFVAHSMGYLKTDRLFSKAELDELKVKIRRLISTTDFTTESFFDTFGTPSWPNSNPGFFHPRTYLYLSQEPEVDFIACDFYNEANYTPGGGKASGVYGEIPRLRNIRVANDSIATQKFKDQFVFTEFGKQIVEECLNRGLNLKKD